MRALIGGFSSWKVGSGVPEASALMASPIWSSGTEVLEEFLDVPTVGRSNGWIALSRLLLFRVKLLRDCAG